VVGEHFCLTAVAWTWHYFTSRFRAIIWFSCIGQLHWFSYIKLKIELQLMYIFAAILKLVLNYLTRNITC